MHFSVLGTLEVRTADELIDIRRGNPRSLLCALVVHSGETVSADALIHHVWGDDLPANPANALHTQMAYLRRVLGGTAAAPIVTKPTGYVLEVDREAVDSHLFERLSADGRALVEAGTASSLRSACEAFDQGLALWRGPAIFDVPDRPLTEGEANRLDELRLQVVERRIDALLALGQHADAVSDLGALTSQEPLRERFHEQLVLALYRSARQGDALRACDHARRLLADELGLDPGPGLRTLEAQILNQDPALDWVAPVGAGQAAVTATADALPEGHSALPQPTSSLVGREAEVGRALELLGTNRMLTLTGPGGGGKTRLAIEIAHQVSERRPVFFVDLSNATGESVPVAVAAAVGVDVTGDTDATAAVADACATTDALLVLDTCEHVVEAVAAVVDVVLARTSSVHVLATSQRPVGSPVELAWPIPPLRLPGEQDDPLDAPAVQLFVERAQRVNPEMTVDRESLEHVAAICRGLDGLPLAIELAAGQSDVLTPASIRSRLDDRFALLRSNDALAASRQRTVRATIEWSVQLLDDRQRRVLSQLAVFAGSFDLAAADAVCSDDADAVGDVLSLVRSSLVSRHGHDRFRLLDTVKAFAREALGPSAPAGTQRRHARHFAGLAGQASSKVRSPAQNEWIRRLHADGENLRAALHWCFSPGGDKVLGATLAGAVAWAWTLEGRFTEARQALERAAAVEDAPMAVRGRVLLGIGLMAAPLGDLATAREVCTESAEWAAKAGDTRLEADAMLTLGVAHWGMGDLDEAASVHDDAIARFVSAGDRWGATVSRILRARTALDAGDLETAGPLIDLAIDEARATGDAHVVGLAFEQHARAALIGGDLERAMLAARECLAQNESISYAEGVVAALQLLARIRAESGETDASHVLQLRALDIAHRLQHAGAVCEALESLAALDVARGDDDHAALLLLHARRLRDRRGIPARKSDEVRVNELCAHVRDRLGARWDSIARLVPLAALDDVVAELIAAGATTR